MTDKKISDLTADGAITGTEELPVNDSGTTKKVTVDAIEDKIVDAAVDDAIVDGETAKAPSQNVVFDALVGKQASDTQLDSVAALVFAGNALKVMRVNAGATAFELVTMSGGASTIDALTDAISNDAAHNMIFGQYSGTNITTANDCTSVGFGALNALTTGISNTAYGAYSLYGVVAGDYNTAFGSHTLQSTVSSNNTAFGYYALNTNTTGTYNVAVGAAALIHNTGSSNTGIGANVATLLTSGSNNIIGGDFSAGNLSTGSLNTVYGSQNAATLITGGQNVVIGYGADVSTGAATNQIAIGTNAVCTGNNKAQIGNSSVTELFLGNYKITDPVGSQTGIASGVTIQEVVGGAVHKTIFTFTNVTVALTDDVGVGAYGSAKLYVMPKGMYYTTMLSVLENIVITKSSAGVSDTWSGINTLGNVAANSGNIANAGEGFWLASSQNITLGPAVAGVLTDKAFVGGYDGPQLNVDATTTTGDSSDIYLNISVNDADQDVTGTPCNLILNGTITLLWANAGDF